MCIFTGSVDTLEQVAGTSILARALADRRQILVYSMRITASAELAMVLPIPVPTGADEAAVRFIDLEGYPTFFEDLDLAFPAPQYLSVDAIGGGIPLSRAASILQVHDVGAFEASFVPSPADFGRLDPRFRLSKAVLSALGGYTDWGFAVFQLGALGRPSSWLDRLFGRRGPASTKTIHPMAFEFPVRDPSRLFFPTVHVHDGQVRERAAFDHALYVQPLAGQQITDSNWQPSSGLAGVVDPVRGAAVIDVGLPCFKTELRGMFANADIHVAPAA